MSRWTESAKWAEGPALNGRRDMPLALRLSEGLGLSVGLVGLFVEDEADSPRLGSLLLHSDE